MVFVSGTGGRRPAAGLALAAALVAALAAMVESLALEVAPVRVTLIAAEFADIGSASLPGDQIDERRSQPHAALPVDRVSASADIAALPVDLMTNTVITGATIDIVGGQQLMED